MSSIGLGSLSLASLASLSGCNFFLPDDSSVSDLDLLEPLQVNLQSNEISPGVFELASFSAKVLVLGRKDYPLDKADVLSVVSPIDLAVAWGEAAKPVSRKAVQLSQADRRYEWRARVSDMEKPGVGDFTALSGNWHMMPADERILSEMQKVNKDHVVSLDGLLVQVYFTDGTFYKSSLSRNDTGDGACEIILVKNFKIEGEIPLES